MVYFLRAEVEDLQREIRQSSESPVAEKVSGGGEVKSAHYVAERAVDEEEAGGLGSLRCRLCL